MSEFTDEGLLIAFRLKQSLIEEASARQDLINDNCLPHTVKNYVELSKSIIDDLCFILTMEYSRSELDVESLVNKVDGGKLAVRAVKEKQLIQLQAILDNAEHSLQIKKLEKTAKASVRGGSHSEYEAFEVDILDVLTKYHEAKSSFDKPMTQIHAINLIEKSGCGRPSNSTFNNWYKRFKQNKGKRIFNVID